MEMYVHFGAQRCKTYAFFEKKLQIKVVFEIKFRTKSLWAHMSISPTSGARGSKDQYV